MGNNGMKFPADHGAAHKNMAPGQPAGCRAAQSVAGACGLSDLPRRHLGDLNLDAKLDLTQHRIEAGFAGTVLEKAGSRLELRQNRGRKLAAEQPDLELVKRIKSNPPAFDGVAATLACVFHALQGN
jgi:hypothetical protein